MANKFLEQGPPHLTEMQLTFRLYAITDLLDDLKDVVTSGERCAIATELYQQLADFCLRANNCWSGKGKWLHRRLQQEYPDLADQLYTATITLFVTENREDLIQVAEEILKPFGGFLWDGYYLPGELTWKKTVD